MDIDQIEAMIFRKNANKYLFILDEINYVFLNFTHPNFLKALKATSKIIILINIDGLHYCQGLCVSCFCVCVRMRVHVLCPSNI